MIKSEFISMSSAIAERPMTDSLGFVVECFHTTIVDRNLKVAEDVFLVSSDQPSEIANRL